MINTFSCLLTLLREQFIAMRVTFHIPLTVVYWTIMKCNMYIVWIWQTLYIFKITFFLLLFSHSSAVWDKFSTCNSNLCTQLAEQDGSSCSDTRACAWKIRVGKDIKYNHDETYILNFVCQFSLIFLGMFIFSQEN